MECWKVADENRLVHLEAEWGCGSAPEEEIFVLLSSEDEPEQLWEGRRGEDDEQHLDIRYEVEDGVFCRIVEESFPSGRTNYDREIELEDLEELPPSEWPDEESLRETIERWKRDRRSKDKSA